MRILFEHHPYQSADVEHELKGIYDLQDVDKKISVTYVGYFYNPDIEDCVFILPKVLLTDETIEVDGKKTKIEVIAGVPKKEDGKFVRPEDIITPEGQEKHLQPEYRKFIYEFAVWIYRALDVFRKANPKTNAIYYHRLPESGRGSRHQARTFLDIVLSLIRFNEENQDFFLFTVKNLHSGHNKINWTKTIAHSQAFIQSGQPIYLNPVNKKRVINFDEELFVIFFSIINYLNDQFGFRAPINIQYDIIKGQQFERYKDGYGKTRLLQIRYKYFSDKALELWDLCMAFFESAHKIAINTTQKEYLLAKKFEIVFEAMIDELIGDSNVPKGLKEQEDGKRVDHMYTYYGLTSSNDQRDQIYYIGDSKYYKSRSELGPESIYKQFTYARNVIQWNIDLFVNGKSENWGSKEEFEEDKNRFKGIKLRDDEADPLTEGYNVIPNFFISAFVDEKRQYNDGENIRNREEEVDGKKVHKTYISTQFPNRLFDRDTLILSHYDVNFLYVLSLYARNKQYEKAAWRDYVRDRFRNEIRNVLSEKYDFFALKSKGNPLAGEEFIKEHFKELQGKLYRPYEDKNLYSLALEKKKDADSKKSNTYHLLEEFFEITEIKQLGDNPQKELEEKVQNYQRSHPYSPTPANWLPEYHVERYVDNYFVVGLYHDQKHWDWITGKNDRGSLIYNVRLSKERKGSMAKSRIRAMKPKFAILYEEGHEAENNYHVFRIHDYAEMSEDRMKQALYPREPQGEYFIFRFDEEVSIGRFDIHQLISTHRIFDNDFVEGSPIYLTGEKLLDYRIGQ